MPKTKFFDYAEMKNWIQAEISKENEGLSEVEVTERRRVLLETCDDPVARKWCQLRRSGMTATAQDKPQSF
jgi:hypothetical protein